VNLIVLGATGFIGSNVLSPLLDSGCQIFAVARQPDRLRNIDVAGVRWLTQLELEQTMLPSIDVILSVAGIGNPAAFEADPTAASNVECRITDLVCKLALKYQVPKIVYLSSGGTVYGEGWKDGKGSVFDESDTCTPISTYGKCKWDAEQRLAKQLESAGLLQGLMTIRASNVYGLHYAKHGRQGLVNALVEQALQNRPITIYGDGLVYRDYLYSSDLANAIIKALNAHAWGVFNIASGVSCSILDVVKEFESAIGHPLEKRFQPTRGFDVKYSALSIRKAKKLLGWSPAVNLRRGIELLLQHQCSFVR
jgi:UDP-glucose 4-epimerase